MSTDLETYRGVVYRWEVDHNDHLTVAYYFARLGDATLALLDALGLASETATRLWLTADCYVRYQRELRVGDIMHITSAPLSVADDGFAAGHTLVDTGTGAVASTFEQRLRLVGADGSPIALTPAERAQIEARRATWTGPARDHRPQPKSRDDLRVSARDTIKSWEGGASIPTALAAYVHRFSASNSHVRAEFGLTPAYMRDQHRGFSTFEFQFAAVRPLTAGTRIVVRSGILHVGTSSLRLFHVMSDARSGVELATLHQSGVHLDHDARRPAPLPADLAERARRLLVPTAG